LAPLASAYRAAPQFNATICYVQRNELRSSPPLCASCCRAPQSVAPQLGSTICLLLRRAPLCYSARRTASLLIAPQRFVCYNATRLASTRRGSLPLSSTQRFVCYNATQRTAARRTAPSGSAPLRASTQLDDLFVTSLRNALQQYASLLIVPRHNSVQRTETLTRKTNVQTFETNFGNV
jgi:hypothetical protein